MKSLDKYDHMILDIIHMHKVENQCHIRLAVLERNFWKRIEEDTDTCEPATRIGERITNLYLDGLIQNKDGYALTKKGREQLALAPWKQEAVGLNSDSCKQKRLILWDRLFYCITVWDSSKISRPGNFSFQ